MKPPKEYDYLDFEENERKLQELKAKELDRFKSMFNDLGTYSRPFDYDAELPPMMPEVKMQQQVPEHQDIIGRKKDPIKISVNVAKKQEIGVSKPS